MPTIQIDGVGKVQVDDSFSAMAPDAQQAFVANIVSQAQSGQKSGIGGAAAAPVLDQYQQAAVDERNRLQKAGLDPTDGIAGRFLHGATLGASDEILAGLQTPLSMIQHGTLSPAEGYKYAKARENLNAADSKKQTGLLGDAAELVGGAGIGAGAAHAGMTLARPGMGLLGRSAAMAGEGAGYGTVTGALDGGDNLYDRGAAALKGGLLGGVLGGLMPSAINVAGMVAAPIMSNIRARISPTGVAESQVARMVGDSGVTPQQIAQQLTDAQAAGQGQFAVADALGNAGQRGLSAVARSPGPGRTDVVNFLDARQAGQGRRMSNMLEEGMNAPATAADTTAALTTLRTNMANQQYGAARNSATAVDVSPAINIIDRTLQPGAQNVMRPQTNIADDSIEAALRRARGYLTDGNSVLTDFNGVSRAKDELNAMIERASPTVQRQLIPVRDALHDSLTMASPDYAAARNQFRTTSGVIDAVGAGRQAATRGRTENTIPAFNRLSQPEQQAFRVGYVDPLIEQTQGAAMGVNKARPFTSDAMQAEIPAFNAYQGPQRPGGTDQLLQRINRENTMFETRAAATGGSKTADNLADQGALHIDPTVIASLLAGHPGPALAHGLRGAANGLTGNTPEVRQAIGGLLTQTGEQAGPVLQGLLARVADRVARQHQIANLASSGLLAGTGESGIYRK